MTTAQEGLYDGKVVHQRLRPVGHRLEYRVASLVIDVDRLAGGKLPRLFSYNRFNLFSINDRDHGDRTGTETVSAFAWNHVRAAGLAGETKRILLLSYPRILGYAFNPLSCFFALDGQGAVRLVIYEVHNTFGGRHCYVAGPFASGEDPFVLTEKTFRVSPFNAVEGVYGLRAKLEGDHAAVGVTLSTADGPLLKAYFAGERKPFTSGALLSVFFKLPLMTFKVFAAIHLEAWRLYRKGLRLQSP